MLSATGLMTATAALVLAATGYVLVQQAPASDPAAAGAAMADPSQASTFSGTRSSTPRESSAGEVEFADGITANRGRVANGITVESSDGRFSGTLDFTMNEDKYEGTGAGVFWGEQTLRNDEGEWRGLLVGAGAPMVGQWQATVHMEGSGAYQGLVAIVYYHSDLSHEGVIIPGPLPPRD